MNDRYHLQEFSFPKNSSVRLGMGRCEWEHTATHLLLIHLKDGKPFSEPISLKYSHDDMVEAGYLESCGDKMYKLTDLSLALLYKKYRKDQKEEIINGN